MARKIQKRTSLLTENWKFFLLCGFLVLTLLTGGSPRGEVQSLVVLRPVAALLCGVALFSLRWEQIKAHRFLLSMAAAVIVLTAVHLIPLPTSIWSSLPGRGIITEIDKTAGLGEVSRPFTMAPTGGWNALFALLIPLAVLLLGIQLKQEQLRKLLPALLIFGLLSGLTGIAQSVGGSQSGLYFYEVTSNGSAVGFFANRNHQAVLLAMLFPMLAVFAATGLRSEEQLRIKLGLAIAAGVLLVPLIIVTGSRAGLIAGVLSLASVSFLYRRPARITPMKRKGKSSLPINWGYAAIGFTIFCLTALMLLMSRSQAIDRLFKSENAESDRFVFWPVVTDVANNHMPWGSGIGSFVEVFQIYEPSALLDPYYLNHAHNDWLEIWMTAGVPGMLLLAIAVLAFFWVAWRAFRTPKSQGSGILFARLGAMSILILGLASIADYPLRTPMLSCVFVIAALWMCGLKDSAEQQDQA